MSDEYVNNDKPGKPNDMTDDFNQVVALASELTALRQRLAQLNAERGIIEGQIAGYVDRIAAAAVDADTSPLPNGEIARVLGKHSRGFEAGSETQPGSAGEDASAPFGCGYAAL